MPSNASNPTHSSSPNTGSVKHWLKQRFHKHATVPSTKTQPETEPKLLEIEDPTILPEDAGPVYTEVWIRSRLPDSAGYIARPKIWYPLSAKMSEEEKSAALADGISWQRRLQGSTVGQWNSSKTAASAAVLNKTITDEHLSRYEERIRNTPAGSPSWHLSPTAYIIDSTDYSPSSQGLEPNKNDGWADY